MHYKFSKTVVVALGGSIVYPDGIDVHFLKDFKIPSPPFPSNRSFAKLTLGDL